MTSLLDFASIIGSIAFAFSGFLVGVRHRFDWMGVFIMAFLTANGGGMIRDLLIGKTPAVLQSNTPMFVVGGTMALSIMLQLHEHPDLERRGWFVVSDAIGLVAFATTGGLAGIEAGFPMFGVITLALITAVGGGLLRDVLVRDTSFVLSEGFYGTIAVLIGFTLHVFALVHILLPSTVLLVCAVALGLRLVAYRRGWRLPKIGR